MEVTSKTVLATAVAVLIQCGVGPASGQEIVHIKKWKVDVVDLYNKPNGQVVEKRDASKVEATEAVRMEEGWLKITLRGKDAKEHDYFVEASQVRTDLKLSGLPKCDKLNSATGFAASRGLGEKGCVP